MSAVQRAAAPNVQHQRSNNAVVLSADEDEMTVEQFLEGRFESLSEDFMQHSMDLQTKLRKECSEGCGSIRKLMALNKTDDKLCVILKCTAGSHIGQRFRLEASTENKDEVFKMGRSTGKAFKEKGVSLYKDREISTTHAKVELRNGQAFVIDVGSTNGTQLNGEELEPQNPIRLKEGDRILMGSTELTVHITTAGGEVPAAVAEPARPTGQQE